MGKRKTFGQKVKQVMMDTVETKRNIETYTATAISTTVNSVNLTDVTTGDGSGARDGNQIIARSVYGRFTVGLHASATASVVRFILYTPYQNDNLLSTVDYIERIPNKQHIVWMDKLVIVNTDNPVKRVTISKKFYSPKRKGMIVDYSSGSSNAVERHPVYLAIVSNEATNTPALNGDVTFYYKDP